MDPHPGSDAPQLTELPAPSDTPIVLRPVSISPGVYLPPLAILGGLSPDDWEQFVLEWAHGLKKAETYVSIKRFGGPGDRGIDVAAFLSDSGLEGPWHCFQCKHYQESLAPSDAWPEPFKIFEGAVRGFFTLPTR